MPKFEWGVTLVIERQKCVPLTIEAETLEEAEKKIFDAVPCIGLSGVTELTKEVLNNFFSY